MNSKSLKNKSSLSNVKLFAITAMLAALVTVTTAFVKIPFVLGYCHAGDSVVYLCASILPAPFGTIASAIGGGLADLLAGYPNWALATAIIKALNTVPFIISGIILKKKNNNHIISIPNLIMLIPTSLITIGGYFIANLIMYGMGPAVAEIPINLTQSIVGALIYIALGLGLDSIKFKKNVLN